MARLVEPGRGGLLGAAGLLERRQREAPVGSGGRRAGLDPRRRELARRQVAGLDGRRRGRSGSPSRPRRACGCGLSFTSAWASRSSAWRTASAVTRTDTTSTCSSRAAACATAGTGLGERRPRLGVVELDEEVCPAFTRSPLSTGTRVTRPTTTLPIWMRAGASTRPLATTRWTSSRRSTSRPGPSGPRKARRAQAASRRTAPPPRMRQRHRRTVGMPWMPGVYGAGSLRALDSPDFHPEVRMDHRMWALVYDRKKDPWSTTKGLRKEQVARPTLDVGKDYRDASMVIVKPRFAGFCGSDRGIWFRRAFGDMIQSTLAAEGKDARVIGHELLGEVVEAGPEATRDFGLRARRRGLHREPHHLQHLLPVPHRRQPRLRHRPHHRHQRGRLLRRVREAAGPGPLAHRRRQDPARGGGAPGAVRKRRARLHQGEPARASRWPSSAAAPSASSPSPWPGRWAPGR